MVSKVGKQPIVLPDQVKVKIDRGQVTVTGPKGSLSQAIGPQIKVSKTDGQLKVSAKADDRVSRAMHGLTRSLLANMVKGVVEGYEKVLELHGVGYRAALKGDQLTLTVGFSHPVEVEPPEGIKFAVEGKNIIRIKGIDKQLVGQVAAQIRSLRKPEPYKGKGIRYQGEVIKLKPGKAAKVGAEGEA